MKALGEEHGAVSAAPDLDMPAEAAIEVWHDLELARVGKHGYGGTVAEIYAHRLASPRLVLAAAIAAIAAITGSSEAEAAEAELARAAGSNMTKILRRFAALHDHVGFALESRDGFVPIDLKADFPAFGWRVHLRVVQVPQPLFGVSIDDLRRALVTTATHVETLTSMLDELAAHRARARLRAEPQDPDTTDDLPPDAATGLFLDRPFHATDFEWVKMAFDAYLARHDGAGARSGQLRLVFQTIQREPRASAEFLRVMNTLVLPLLRRLRLKEQPHLTTLGVAGE